MKHKLALLIVSLFTLCFMFIGEYLCYENKICGIRTVTQNEWNEIVSERSCEPQNIKLYFEQASVPFDQAQNSYYISQSTGTERWQGALSADEEWNLLILRPDVKKAELIRSGETISLLVYNDETFDVKNLVISGFPVISLEESYTDGEMIYGDMVFMGNEYLQEGNGIKTEEISCRYHVRGGFSASNPKKSYKVNLLDARNNARKESFLGMRDDNDWILNPLFFDNSKMREKIAYDLWNDMTDQYFMHLEYVEVIINNEYQGVYCLQEPIDLKTFNESERSMLYSTKSWDYEHDDDRIYRWDSIPDNEILNEYSFDKYQDPELALELLKVMNAEIKNINYESEYSVIFDEQSYVDHALMINMLLAIDNNYKNQKLLLKATGDKEYTVYKMVWDLDWTFLNENVVESQLPIDEYLVDGVYLNKGEKTELYEKMRDRYLECRKTFYNEEHIYSLVAKYHDALVNSGAISRERMKWPSTDFEANCQYLRDFAAARIFVLDQYFDIGGQ